VSPQPIQMKIPLASVWKGLSGRSNLSIPMPVEPSRAHSSTL